MKKISLFIAVIALITSMSNVFASVKGPMLPPVEPFNGKVYVAKIIAAYYQVENSGVNPYVVITTTSDDKFNQSGLKKFPITIDGKDLPFGFSLMNSVGKKIAVTFLNQNYDIKQIEIVTDEYLTTN